MLSINLVPEGAKKIFWMEVARRMIVRLGIAFFLILGTFTLLLFPSYYFLFFQEGSISDQLEAVRRSEGTDRLQNVEAGVKKINSRLSTIEEFDKKSILPTAVMLRVFHKLPQGVTLQSFSFTYKKKSVGLGGHADTRDAYLYFENALKTDSAFANFSSPVTNLLNARNVSFELSFSLTDDFHNE